MSQFGRSLQLSSNSCFENLPNAEHKFEEGILESKFDFLSKNLRIFSAIIRHLADIRARNMKVLEKLTDKSYRKFAFTQLATQAIICLDLMLELYAMVKTARVCVILLEISNVIQKKMSILDDFFSGIAEYDKGLEKEYLKDIIEYFDSIKEPQIIELHTYIEQLKTQLSIESNSCQQKSFYDKDLFVRTARPLFKLKKLTFAKIIQTNSRASTQKVSEAKRKCGDEPGHGKYLERRPHFPANNERYQRCNKKEADKKVDNLKIKQVDSNAMKENKSVMSNCIPEKEGRVSDKSSKIKQNFDKIQQPTNHIIEKITGKIESKNSLENEPSYKNYSDVLSSMSMNKSVLNNRTIIEKTVDIGHQNMNAKQNILCEGEKDKRTIRFAKVFCSRSIKSSSRGKNAKRFENYFKHNMHTVLPLIMNNRGFKNIERKRKRTIDDEVGMSSAPNNAKVGSEGKRIRYDN